MIGVSAQHQPSAMRPAACEHAFASGFSGRLPGSWVRFGGNDTDKPPEDPASEKGGKKGGGWLGRTKGLLSKAKALGKKTVERIQTAVGAAPPQPATPAEPDKASPASTDKGTTPAPEATTPAQAPAQANDPVQSVVAAKTDAADASVSKPKVPERPPIPDADVPPSPAKGGVMGWVRNALPGAADALEYVTQSVDHTLKQSFLTQLIEETGMGPYLAKMNGFARQDFDGVLLQHPIKDRGFYQAVLADGKAIVDALEKKGEDEAAAGFLNEHFTQQVAQSFSLGDWQARVSLYQCMMRYVQSQKDAAIAQEQNAPEIRDVLRAVDEIQQTHPQVWQLMTALTRGAGEQSPHIQLGHLLSGLIEMRNSVVPARYETLAKWFNSLTPQEVADFVSRPEHHEMVRLDLGIQMYEPWWNTHHQENLINRPPSVPVSAAFARMIHTLAEKLTPSAY